MSKNWIAKAVSPKTKGALRKTLHVKEGETIPQVKLEKAEHSKNPLTRKRAALAATFKKMKK